MKTPKTAYVLLWFPIASETFIFKEVINLWRMGVDLKVFTLYGELTRNLSEEMRSVSNKMERLGIPFLKNAFQDVAYWWKRDRRLTAELLRTVPVRRWNGFEKGGENLWSFLCGFRLARRFQEEGIEHIHAPWANGPATAAWIASRLTGIPFSFTARAWDIYPPDGALKEKIRDATFIRSETMAKIRYLAAFSGMGSEKMHLTYNGVPLKTEGEAPVNMEQPYRLLALGRFVGKKGYNFLLQACKILKDSGMGFHLTLAGAGPRGMQLKRLAAKLGLEDRVSFPGFMSYDRVPELFYSSDIFLMPSVIHKSGDRDGIPTVIMEALTHRVPVIATDVSGISELIENEVTGLLIPEKNPEAIAHAVVRMTTDRQGAIEMAERGRAKVLNQFNPEINHKRVLELYQRLIPAKNG
ncbi:MAG: glycosyltransferase [Desulfomonile tiedjei]|uniref:Glycosyltransferase n=1 Tax=Desulfomonile tiedjei TaxID=2358 RepID=A0A9D6Z8B5_9BACT|nr:glycosyltransferase [Desulfomonile tiedjei]